MEKTTDDIIRAILKRGNDVQIQRKGDGFIILEVRRTVRATCNADSYFVGPCVNETNTV